MFENANTYLIILEYSYIFKYGIISLGVSVLLFSLSIFFVYQKPEKEKMSVYECGFHPYGDARNKFEVKYYIVGILFIIFDLEIMYIFS
jgi:NADH-quinone oxidoreductase subunit A